MATIADKKKKILAHLVKYIDMMSASPNAKKYNSDRYREMFAKMSDTEFDKYMKDMRAGKTRVDYVAPNMDVVLQPRNLCATARALGLELFQRIWLYDETTDTWFLTPKKYPIFRMYVRRQQQFIDEKLSVPNSDRKIDNLTGQVTGDDRSSSLSNPEMQILFTRGLENTLLELAKVRGGDINAYSEYKRRLEELGEVDLATVMQSSRTRSPVITSVLLKAMHLDNNI